MSNHPPEQKKGQVLLYQTDGGNIKVDVHLEDETVTGSHAPAWEPISRLRLACSAFPRGAWE